MEHIIEIVNFLTQNPFGLILLSILSGVVGNWLFSILKLLYKKTMVKYHHRSIVKVLVKIATAHVHGQRAVKIKYGTPAQAAIWAADYVIEFIKHVSIILGLIMILGIMLVVLPLYLYWLPIIIISIAITIRYKLMKRLLKFFNMTEDLVFGKKYLETEKEGYTQYWDFIFKTKDSNKEESEVDNPKNAKSDSEGVSL